MSTEPEGQPVRLRDLGIRLKRRWRLLLASVLIVTIASILTGLSLPERYTATTTLVVVPLVSDPAVSQQPTTIDIDTEREIMRSTAVADLASAELGEPEARGALLAGTDVAAPSGTQLLRVSVTASDPERAARYSVAVAEAYLAFRQQRAEEAAERYVDAIDDEIAQLEASGSSDAQRWINTLLERRQNTSLLQFHPGRIIGEAVPPSSPSSLGLPAFLAAGLVGGLLLGVVLVLFRDRTDRRLHFPERFAELTASSPLVVGSMADHEALRWLVREVDTVKAGDDLPRVVGVVTVGKSTVPSFPRAVADAMDAAGQLVIRVDPSGRDQRTIDLGWPTTRYKDESWGSATAVLDLDGIESWTTLARLAERSDVIVVVTTPATRTDELRETWLVLTAAAPALIPVFVSPRRRGLGQARPGPLAAAVRGTGLGGGSDLETGAPRADRALTSGGGGAPRRSPVPAATTVEPARRGRESG